MENSWKMAAVVFSQLARTLRQEWQCSIPPFDTLPSEELDLVVSAWCWELAGNLAASIDPPAEVKPWVLARLASACAQAHLEAAEGNPCPVLSTAVLRNMLVGSWHQLLREKWNLMVLEDLEDLE